MRSDSLQICVRARINAWWWNGYNKMANPFLFHQWLYWCVMIHVSAFADVLLFGKFAWVFLTILLWNLSRLANWLHIYSFFVLPCTASNGKVDRNAAQLNSYWSTVCSVYDGKPFTDFSEQSKLCGLSSIVWAKASRRSVQIVENLHMYPTSAISYKAKYRISSVRCNTK